MEVSMAQFLVAKEVAEILGKSLKWLYQNQTRIPGRFVIGKSIFWDKEVLMEALKSQARKPVRR
jgi:predicted DNA-binding transcriptional regulator AlpA